MKVAVRRILCFSLILLISSYLLVGCGSNDGTDPKAVSSVSNATSQNAASGDTGSSLELQEEIMQELTENDPYTISPDADGNDIVILKKEAGVVTMVVAEKTTLNRFAACVTTKDGFVFMVTDAQGNSIVDDTTEIVDGMIFKIYEDGKDEAVVTLTIVVVSQEIIEETIEKNEEIKQENEEIKDYIENQKPVEDENGNGGSNNQPVAMKGAIKLCSIWSSSYNSTDASGQVWNSTFNSIKNKQGISTAIINLNGENAADVVVKDVMAGKADVDVYETSSYIARSIARKGCLANLKTSKTIIYSNFDNAGTTSMTFGGKLYGVAIDFKATKIMGVTYNKDLIAKYASTYDIEKLYKEKKWDFDAFKGLAKECTRDLNGDGRPDVHGLTSNTNVIGMALTANAGGTALMENGRVVATMCSEQGVAALEWMKKLYNTDRSWKYLASIKDSINYFANGQAAMFASWMSYYGEIVPKASFKVGFVLMPKGPDQKDYISGQYDAQFYIVPKTKEDRLDLIGEWLNGVSGASGKLINNEIKNLAKNGFDQYTQEIYKWGVKNATPEYSSGVFTQSISSQVDSCVTSASKSPAKIMASIKDQAQKELDDFFNPLY